MTFRILTASLILSSILLSSDIELEHRDSAERDCRQCHDACFQSGDNGHIGTDNNGCACCHHWTVVGSDLYNVSKPDNSDCVRCHTNSTSYRVNSAHQGAPCVSCHSPHGSSYNFLLKKGSNSLCTEQCHISSELGRSHPRGQGKIDPNTGGEISCISSCHRIHTTCSDKLLSASTPALCARCHPDKV